MDKIIVENKIVMKKISEIKPYIRNPRKNDKTVELLCDIIPKVGFNVPLVIDEKGIIVKGHARFTAAIRLGLKELPCIVTHADEEAIKADRIADNKISEFSEWVNEELMHEIDSLNFDLDLTEFGLPLPSFDDFPTFDDLSEEIEEESDEDKKKRYEEYLQKQEAQYEKAAQMTSERKLEAAHQAQSKVAVNPPKYYKCVCEKCGHVMFVREGDAMLYE